MSSKAALGKRHTCFSCGKPFYDLNRPAAVCPKCGADQAENPQPGPKPPPAPAGKPRKKVPLYDDDLDDDALDDDSEDEDLDDDDSDDMGLDDDRDLDDDDLD